MSDAPNVTIICGRKTIICIRAGGAQPSTSPAVRQIAREDLGRSSAGLGIRERAVAFPAMFVEEGMNPGKGGNNYVRRNA
jgi:hypothetical protein